MRPYDVDKGVATGQDTHTTGVRRRIAMLPYMTTREKERRQVSAGHAVWC
jgi:hypothetical protein